jgi:REP element-mobilizing transposase RayT
MPRGPRLDARGCAHHVIIRGIAGCRIFLSDEDRLDFLRRLERLLPEGHWRCFAWALMPNHVHLVVKSTQGGLSRLMARLNTGYARGFNLRHCRSGYLFQNRFKSRLAEDHADLMGLVVYTHRNPLAAGLVDSLEVLERHPWCGHSALVGCRPPLAFESIGASLSLFAEDEAEARHRVREWMSGLVSGNTSTVRPDGVPRKEMLLYPSPAEQELSSSNEFPDPKRHIELDTGGNAPLRIEELIRAASKLFGVSIDEVCSPCQRRGAAQARAAVAHLAVEKLGLPGRTVAAALRVSPSAVSHALRRGRLVVENERIRIASGPIETCRKGS